MVAVRYISVISAWMSDCPSEGRSLTGLMTGQWKQARGSKRGSRGQAPSLVAELLQLHDVAPSSSQKSHYKVRVLISMVKLM